MAKDVDLFGPLTDTVSRFFGRPFEDDFFERPASLIPFARSTGAISVDAEDDAYKVKVEVPGFTADQVKAEVDRGVLRVEAQREDVDRKPGSYNERTSRVARTINLGDDVDTAKEFSAELKDGVLSVSVPRKPADQDKKVSIEVK